MVTPTVRIQRNERNNEWVGNEELSDVIYHHSWKQDS